MARGIPTNADLQRADIYARALIVFAVAAPILALLLPRPVFIDLGNWFGRSGAVTTVFALLAEVLLVRARLLLTPAGHAWDGFHEQRTKFLPLFDRNDQWIFVLTIVGTIIWAYGDVPFIWIERWVQSTCGLPLK
ncbi:hypothetical protein PPUTLS46_011490 [Pseudomonas putida LS46]|nr:hypothetical protein PPUTLS46_011490 [Pseudomonas putida LS46]PEI10886.1 hypothetical protein CRM86_24445 [Pseudomonas putida]